MNTGPLSFEVDQFEYVVASPETVLLRVAGRWRSAARERLPPPVLLIDDGRQVLRLAALPGPADGAPSASPEGPPWKAGYSVKADLLRRPRTVFALDVGERGLVDLPRPTVRERAPLRPPEPTPDVRLADETNRREAAAEQARLSEERLLRRRAEEAAALHARERREREEGRAAAETSRIRAEQDRIERERASAVAAARAERGRLQARLVEAETALAHAREEADAAVRAARRARAARPPQAGADTRRKRDRVDERLRDAVRTAERERARASAAETARAEAATDIAALAPETEQRTAELSEAHRQLAIGRTELEEARELARVARELADQRAEAQRGAETRLAAAMDAQRGAAEQAQERAELVADADAAEADASALQAEHDRARDAVELARDARDDVAATLARERTHGAESLLAAREQVEQLGNEASARESEVDDLLAAAASGDRPAEEQDETVQGAEETARALELERAVAALREQLTELRARAGAADEELRASDDALSAAHDQIAGLDPHARALASLQARLAELAPLVERMDPPEPEAERLDTGGDRSRGQVADAALRIVALEAELAAAEDRHRAAEERLVATGEAYESAAARVAALAEATGVAMDRTPAGESTAEALALIQAEEAEQRTESVDAATQAEQREARAGEAERRVAELERAMAEARARAEAAEAATSQARERETAARREAARAADGVADADAAWAHAEEHARAFAAVVSAEERHEAARADEQRARVERCTAEVAALTSERDDISLQVGRIDSALALTDATLGTPRDQGRALVDEFVDASAKQSALRAGLEAARATVAHERLVTAERLATSLRAREAAGRELTTARRRIAALGEGPQEPVARRAAPPVPVRRPARLGPPRAWGWIPVIVAVPLLAALVTAGAYAVSPIVALIAPFAIVAVVAIFHRPIWGVYAALLAVPGESLNFPLGPVSVSPSEALFLLVALAAALRFLGTGHARALHPAHTAFLLLQAVTILGLLVATDTFTLLKVWADWSAFLVVSILVASASLVEIRRIMYCVAAAAAALALESLATGGSQTLVDGGLAATDRAQGAFTHPAQLAFFLVLAVPLALSLSVAGRRKLRPVMLAVAALATVALVMTLTRGSIIGFAASLAVLVTWARFRRLAALFLGVGAVVVAFNFGAIANSQQVSVVSTRLGTISQGASAGGGRLNIYKTAPTIIADHPWLGVGGGNFAEVSLAYGLSEGGQAFEHAHDLPLTIAAERGLGGLALLVLFIGALARTGIRLLRARDPETYPYALGLSAAMFGLGINSLVDYPVQAAVMGTLMVEVGALIALSRHLDARLSARAHSEDGLATRARSTRAEEVTGFATTRQPVEPRRVPSARR